MTVLTTETDRDERVEVKVYVDDSGSNPRLSAHTLHEPVSSVCVIQCNLTESNLRQLKGYDDGISTSATVYDAIEEAVYNTEYRNRIPYQK